MKVEVSDVLTERGRQIELVKKWACTKCRVKRLLVGPDWDRWRLRCMNCGHMMRAKRPKGFTR